MRLYRILPWLGLSVVLLAGCGRDEGPVSPAVPLPIPDLNAGFDVDQAAVEVFETSGWTVPDDVDLPAALAEHLGKGRPLFLRDFVREVLADDIVHYSYILAVGDGEYDVIGIHRVVRERRPYKPIHARENIFLQHGCCKDFVGMYLPGLYSETTPDDFGFAAFLARNDVDVWGIDQDWALAGEDAGGTGVMMDWGLERGMSNLRTAMDVARVVRLMTGSGNGKLILSGYSNGGISTIALLDYESQLPDRLRNIGAFIPVDAPIKLDPAGELAALLAGFVDGYYAPTFEAGIYEDANSFPTIGGLARCCPDDASPFDPSVTNLQFAINQGVGAAFDADVTPFHYLAGLFDANGIATGLRFTDLNLWIDFLASGNPYEPTIWSIDWIDYATDRLDTPWDDHLDQIAVPVLNIAAAGGYGSETLYGLALLGSHEVETLIVETGLPPLEEIGHIDLFAADESEALAWESILGWIREQARH